MELYWRSFGEWRYLGTVALPSDSLRHLQQRRAQVGGSAVLHHHDRHYRCHGSMAAPEERLCVACCPTSCLSQCCHPMVVRFDDGRNRESSVVCGRIWGCTGCDFDSVCNSNLEKWYERTRTYSSRHWNSYRVDFVAPKQTARAFRFEPACRLFADERLGLIQVATQCG